MKQIRNKNRVELLAEEGSVTAQNTLRAYTFSSKVSMASTAKGPTYEKSKNNGYRGK